ncbi:DUF6776 family protein [Pleionea sediminis]|uniref:DUF6776 family protein n=1 Tax=Pleionea sediminis TaxID=2569479 RepID=UPI001186BFDC|nr:DUF6776 family protein [Pleionea sediminis]
MSDHLIITKKRSPLWYLLWIVIVVVLLITAFYFGRLDGREERLELIDSKDLLERQVEEYANQITSLEQKNIMLQSSADVESQASEEIMETITALKQTIDSMDTELAFYRGIMAPEKDIKGLHISDFTLREGISERSFDFQLALTQVKKHDVFLKGDVTIVVNGLLSGEPKEYNFKEISGLDDKDFDFTFKYFQHIKGQITLPPGFEPKAISVTATTSGRKSQTATRKFNWSV